MNRKPWVIAGIIIVVLFVIGIMLLRTNRSSEPATVTNPPVSELTYCNEKQFKPCVVSFSIDADDNMLVNILLPDISFPNFYLKIVRGEAGINYKCQRVGEVPNSAYCIGERLPPGETLHLMLISTRDEVLLAEGDLSIIGLALSVPAIAVPTQTSLPTGLPITTGTITVTATSTPTPTSTPVRILPTPTRTKSSYENPTYP